MSFYTFQLVDFKLPQNNNEPFFKYSLIVVPHTGYKTDKWYLIRFNFKIYWKISEKN